MFKLLVLLPIVAYSFLTISCNSPAIKCKNPNMTFVEDPSSQCVPRTCAEVGFPLACMQPGSPPQKPGCLCKRPLVKNCKGECVDPSQCKSCGGDFNATTGCNNYCGHTCSDQNVTHPFCPLFCMFNGCACKQGYLYDNKNNINRCVLPKDCSQ